MVTFMIYLLVMCEQIATMIAGFAVFLTTVAVISAVVSGFVTLALAAEGGAGALFDNPDEDGEGAGFWKSSFGKTVIKWWKWTVFFAFACHLLAPLIPSQKNMAMIIAGSATYHAVTSEPAQRIGGKALKLLENKLDEAIDNVDKKVDNDGSQSKEEKESNGKVQAPQSGSQESAQGTST